MANCFCRSVSLLRTQNLEVLGGLFIGVVLRERKINSAWEESVVSLLWDMEKATGSEKTALSTRNDETFYGFFFTFRAVSSMSIHACKGYHWE